MKTKKPQVKAKKPTLAVIDNSVPQSVLARIPANEADRFIFLQSKLARYTNKSVYSKALGVKVTILPESIGETCFWAKKSRTSTIMALNMGNVIRNAAVLETDKKPKKGKQTKDFHFKKVHILWVKVRRYGVAKLTVGKLKKGDIIEYCVTDFYAKTNLKKKKGG